MQTSPGMARLCIPVIIVVRSVGHGAKGVPASPRNGHRPHPILVRIAPRDLRGRPSDRSRARLKNDTPLDPGSVELAQVQAARTEQRPGSDYRRRSGKAAI